MEMLSGSYPEYSSNEAVKVKLPKSLWSEQSLQINVITESTQPDLPKQEPMTSEIFSSLDNGFTTQQTDIQSDKENKGTNAEGSSCSEDTLDCPNIRSLQLIISNLKESNTELGEHSKQKLLVLMKLLDPENKLNVNGLPNAPSSASNSALPSSSSSPSTEEPGNGDSTYAPPLYTPASTINSETRYNATTIKSETRYNATAINPETRYNATAINPETRYNATAINSETRYNATAINPETRYNATAINSETSYNVTAINPETPYNATAIKSETIMLDKRDENQDESINMDIDIVNNVTFNTFNDAFTNNNTLVNNFIDNNVLVSSNNVNVTSTNNNYNAVSTPVKILPKLENDIVNNITISNNNNNGINICTSTSSSGVLLTTGAPSFTHHNRKTITVTSNGEECMRGEEHKMAIPSNLAVPKINPNNIILKTRIKPNTEEVKVEPKKSVGRVNTVAPILRLQHDIAPKPDTDPLGKLCADNFSDPDPKKSIEDSGGILAQFINPDKLPDNDLTVDVTSGSYQINTLPEPRLNMYNEAKTGPPDKRMNELLLAAASQQEDTAPLMSLVAEQDSEMEIISTHNGDVLVGAHVPSIKATKSRTIKYTCDTLNKRGTPANRKRSRQDYMRTPSPIPVEIAPTRLHNQLTAFNNQPDSKPNFQRPPNINFSQLQNGLTQQQQLAMMANQPHQLQQIQAQQQMMFNNNMPDLMAIANKNLTPAEVQMMWQQQQQKLQQQKIQQQQANMSAVSKLIHRPPVPGLPSYDQLPQYHPHNSPFNMYRPGQPEDTNNPQYGSGKHPASPRAMLLAQLQGNMKHRMPGPNQPSSFLDSTNMRLHVQIEEEGKSPTPQQLNNHIQSLLQIHPNATKEQIQVLLQSYYPPDTQRLTEQQLSTNMIENTTDPKLRKKLKTHRQHMQQMQQQQILQQKMQLQHQAQQQAVHQQQQLMLQQKMQYQNNQQQMMLRQQLQQQQIQQHQLQQHQLQQLQHQQTQQTQQMPTPNSHNNLQQRNQINPQNQLQQNQLLAQNQLLVQNHLQQFPHTQNNATQPPSTLLQHQQLQQHLLDQVQAQTQAPPVRPNVEQPVKPEVQAPPEQFSFLNIPYDEEKMKDANFLSTINFLVKEKIALLTVEQAKNLSEKCYDFANIVPQPLLKIVYDKVRERISEGGVKDMLSPINDTILQRAVKSQSIETLKQCLNGIKDVNTSDCNGVTVLHEAIICDRYDMVQLLLAYNVDVNAVRNGGIRPLHDAVRKGNLQIAQLLLKSGAHPDTKTDLGETPFTLAIANPKIQDLIKGYQSHKQAERVTAEFEQSSVSINVYNVETMQTGHGDHVMLDDVMKILKSYEKLPQDAIIGKLSCADFKATLAQDKFGVLTNFDTTNEDFKIEFVKLTKSLKDLLNVVTITEEVSNS